MAPKVFCTGTTGYIGGDALYAIVNAHPDWELTCAVRNSDKGATIAAQYPKIKLVYGDLEATNMLEEEASNADIVYHFANCDHEGSANAIAKGLTRRAEQDLPAFWIHTSGTMILATETIEKKCWGDLLEKEFNDWDGVNELISHPDHAAHRNVDKIVLACSQANPKVKTAIVCPPTIHGVGRGPDNQRSMQVPGAAKAIVGRGKGFTVGQGKNIWHEVHVQDLADLYLKLGEAAANGGAPATWNNEGYYLAEKKPFVWGDITKSLTKIAHKKGLIKSDEVDQLPDSEVAKLLSWGTLAWGTNSRGASIRGKKLLGWNPHRASIEENCEGAVDIEAKSLKFVKGHAEQVEESHQS